MLRTALKARWLALLAAVLLVMVSFGMLGAWQLNVARDRGHAEALESAPKQTVAPLQSVLQPHTGFPAAATGRRVTATGRYAAQDQVLVAGRRLDGRAGMWVVTPLVLTDNGAWVAVVRGFVSSASEATGPAAMPVGATVTVAGALAPGESPSDAVGLPPGQMGSLDLSVLVNRWPAEIYNAFVFATSEDPDLSAGGSLVRVPPPKVEVTGLSWRNAAYALQWWVFAIFAAYMWWRMVRDDAAQDVLDVQERQEVGSHV